MANLLLLPVADQITDSSYLLYDPTVGTGGLLTVAENVLSGASPYGVMDMAGNVWEWVNDWYDSSYYSVSPVSNPQGPATGRTRVLRGGSWVNDDLSVRSALRGRDGPGSWFYDLGFRCARSQ
ncbi:MAG: formylglycine-generating enzyme family protein [Caldilinea sp.]